MPTLEITNLRRSLLLWLCRTRKSEIRVQIQDWEPGTQPEMELESDMLRDIIDELEKIDNAA